MPQYKVEHLERMKLQAVDYREAQTPFHAAYAYLCHCRESEVAQPFTAAGLLQVYDGATHVATYSRGALERAEAEGKTGPV